MREAKANWNLQRISRSFPYAWLLVQGRPERQGEFPCGKHPPMDREHRAKLFAPFDALDGFSAQIRKKDRLLDEAAPEKTEESNCILPEDW